MDEPDNIDLPAVAAKDLENGGGSSASGESTSEDSEEEELAAGIVFKSGCPGCPDSAEDSNFPQKDCLRTRKLSVSVPESLQF